jgi:hypothetical protein
MAHGASVNGMDSINHDGQSPQRLKGRPKGAKDRSKRRPRRSVLNLTLSGAELAEFASAGHDVDMVGVLRMAQARLAMAIIEEIDSPDIQRRGSLRDAAVSLHRMEIETLKINPRAGDRPLRQPARPIGDRYAPRSLSEIMNQITGKT